MILLETQYFKINLLLWKFFTNTTFIYKTVYYNGLAINL